MKHTVVAFTSLLLLSLTACKAKSDAKNSGGPMATSEPTVYKGVTNDSCAVEVAFGSYGSGIDGKAFEEIIAAIDARKVKYSSKAIGREGERRLCLPLTELKAKQKEELIGQLKKIAAGAQLVSVSVR